MSLDHPNFWQSLLFKSHRKMDAAVPETDPFVFRAHRLVSWLENPKHDCPNYVWKQYSSQQVGHWAVCTLRNWDSWLWSAAQWACPALWWSATPTSSHSRLRTTAVRGSFRRSPVPRSMCQLHWYSWSSQILTQVLATTWNKSRIYCFHLQSTLWHSRSHTIWFDGSQGLLVRFQASYLYE